jgi:hypothetical protein
MHFNAFEAQTMMEDRVREALREAERERLRRVANSARPRLLARVVASIGGLLLSAGKKLQECQGRSEPVWSPRNHPASERRGLAESSGS